MHQLPTPWLLPAPAQTAATTAATTAALSKDETYASQWDVHKLELWHQHAS